MTNLLGVCGLCVDADTSFQQYKTDSCITSNLCPEINCTSENMLHLW